MSGIRRGTPSFRGDRHPALAPSAILITSSRKPRGETQAALSYPPERILFLRDRSPRRRSDSGWIQRPPANRGTPEKKWSCEKTSGFRAIPSGGSAQDSLETLEQPPRKASSSDPEPYHTIPTLKPMKPKHTLAALAATTLASHAAVFSDDFESYSTGDPAVMTNWDHNGNGTAPNASRIFDTGNFGGSRLWIAEAADAAAGTGLNSTVAIPITAGTEYDFSAALVAETDDAGRTASGTFDITIGGSSIIGGPQAFSARGDGTGGDADTYADQLTTFSFNSGANSGNAVISIAFDGTDATNPFVGIDNVSLVPEPGTALLGGLGLLGLMRRRRA